jgi:hypothetical protein
MPQPDLLALLRGGDRRSIGESDRVAAMVSRDLRLFPQLISGLRSEDPLIRMRAGDAAEKVSRTAPKVLQAHKKDLLALMAETDEQELRWHLAAMVPRLELSGSECSSVASAFKSYLKDRSSIVKTSALEGLVDLSRHDPAIHRVATGALRQALRNGTPAMKARSRKLLAQIHAKKIFLTT